MSIVDSKYHNIDPIILRTLERDFRLDKCKSNSLPLQFSDFCEWVKKNQGVLELEEYARSILSCKHGVSLKVMIKVLNSFSNANLKLQKDVVANLLSNDKFVRTDVKFRLKSDSKSIDDKLELDIDRTIFYLQTDISDFEPHNMCYQ